MSIAKRSAMVAGRQGPRHGDLAGRARNDDDAANGANDFFDAAASRRPLSFSRLMFGLSFFAAAAAAVLAAYSHGRHDLVEFAALAWRRPFRTSGENLFNDEWDRSFAVRQAEEQAVAASAASAAAAAAAAAASPSFSGAGGGGSSRSRRLHEDPTKGAEESKASSMVPPGADSKSRLLHDQQLQQQQQQPHPQPQRGHRGGGRQLWGPTASGSIESRLSKWVANRHTDDGGYNFSWAQVVPGSLKEYAKDKVVQPQGRYGHVAVGIPGTLHSGLGGHRTQSSVIVHGGVVQGHVGSDILRFTAGVAEVDSAGSNPSGAFAGLREPTTGRACNTSAEAAGGCGAWSSYDTKLSADDTSDPAHGRRFALDRTYHAASLIYTTHYGTPAQNGRLLTFGGEGADGYLHNDIWELPIADPANSAWHCPMVHADDETDPTLDVNPCGLANVTGVDLGQPVVQVLYEGLNTGVATAEAPLTGGFGTVITSGKLPKRLNCVWDIRAPGLAVPDPPAAAGATRAFGAAAPVTAASALQAYQATGVKYYIVLLVETFDLGDAPYTFAEGHGGRRSTNRVVMHDDPIFDPKDTRDVADPIFGAAGAGLRCGAAQSDTGRLRIELTYTNDCPANKGFRARVSVTTTDPCPRYKKLCGKHGTCVGGLCCCDDGWAGTNCEVRRGRTPRTPHEVLLDYKNVRVTPGPYAIDYHSSPANDAIMAAARASRDAAPRVCGGAGCSPKNLSACGGLPCSPGTAVVCSEPNTTTGGACAELSEDLLPLQRFNSEPRISTGVTDVYPARRFGHAMLALEADSAATVVENTATSASTTRSLRGQYGERDVHGHSFPNCPPQANGDPVVAVPGTSGLCTDLCNANECRVDEHRNFTRVQKALADLCCAYGGPVLHVVPHTTYAQTVAAGVFPLTRLRQEQLVVEEQTIVCKTPRPDYIDVRTNPDRSGGGADIPGPYLQTYGTDPPGSGQIIRAAVARDPYPWDASYTATNTYASKPHHPDPATECPFTLSFGGRTTAPINAYDTADQVEAKIEAGLAMAVDVTISGTIRNPRYEGGGCTGLYTTDGERSDVCCQDAAARAAEVPTPVCGDNVPAAYTDDPNKGLPAAASVPTSGKWCLQRRGVCHDPKQAELRDFYSSPAFEACTRPRPAGCAAGDPSCDPGENTIRVVFRNLTMCNGDGVYGRPKCDIPHLEFAFVDEARCGASGGGSGTVSELVRGVDPYYVVLRDPTTVETFTLSRTLTNETTISESTYGSYKKFVDTWSIVRERVNVSGYDASLPAELGNGASYTNITETYTTTRVLKKTRGTTAVVAFGGWADDAELQGGFRDLWEFDYEQQLGDHWTAADAASHSRSGRACYPTSVVDETFGNVTSVPCANIDRKRHPDFPRLQTRNVWRRLRVGEATREPGMPHHLQPAARRYHSLVDIKHDGFTSHLLLFGGAGLDGYLNDVWHLELHGLMKAHPTVVKDTVLECNVADNSATAAASQWFRLGMDVRLECMCDQVCSCKPDDVDVRNMSHAASARRTAPIYVNGNLHDLERAILGLEDVDSVEVFPDDPILPREGTNIPICGTGGAAGTGGTPGHRIRIRTTFHVHEDGELRTLDADPWQGALAQEPWQDPAQPPWSQRVIDLAQPGPLVADKKWKFTIVDSGTTAIEPAAGATTAAIVMTDMETAPEAEWVPVLAARDTRVLPTFGSDATNQPCPRAHQAAAVVTLADHGKVVVITGGWDGQMPLDDVWVYGSSAPNEGVFDGVMYGRAVWRQLVRSYVTTNPSKTVFGNALRCTSLVPGIIEPTCANTTAEKYPARYFHTATALATMVGTGPTFTESPLKESLFVFGGSAYRRMPNGENPSQNFLAAATEFSTSDTSSSFVSCLEPDMYCAAGAMYRGQFDSTTTS